MSLDSGDLSTISTLRAAGVPVVVVLVSGRPLDIASQVPNWNALLESWLPGTEGNGVADVLFGDYAPTGKLPDTWMQSVNQQPINDGDGQTPLYPFGFGLTYGATQNHSAYEVSQAESWTSQSGTQTESTTDTGGGSDVGHIAAGDWLAYAGVDFGSTGAASVTTRLASGTANTGTVQYRLDSTTGPVIATVPVSSTGGWQTWVSRTATLTAPATGVHSVYVTFTAGAGDLVNLNWFQFAQGTIDTSNAYQQRQAESYTSQSGAQTESTTDTGGGLDVGYIAAGDWLAYPGVDFGTTSPASVTTRIASAATITGTVQYRLDSTTGPVIASVPVSTTGGWQSWTSPTVSLSGTATGAHTLYLTFTANGTGDFVNLNWFQFNH
jgi:beta-glucosidase